MEAIKVFKKVEKSFDVWNSKNASETLGFYLCIEQNLSSLQVRL